MNELEALWFEIQREYEVAYKPTLVWVRVTKYAIERSIAIVRVSDERAEQRGIDLTRVHDPREAVVHPEDWYRILKAVPKDFTEHALPPNLTLIWGIPIYKEA